MSIHYTVDEDGDGRVTLWKHTDPTDRLPQALADEGEDYPEVFRAAAAVLAPDDDVREMLARILWRESVTPTAMTWNRYKADFLRHADSVLARLREHATGGDSDAR